MVKNTRKACDTLIIQEFNNMKNNKTVVKIQDANQQISFEIPKALMQDVSNFIDTAKNHIAREYNSTQVLLYWLIGKRIEEEILQSERADYGESIVSMIAQQLLIKYGKGYSRPNLFRMIKLAQLFPNREIVSTLSRQLSWSHLILICAIEDPLKREFYMEMSRIQNWSVRALKSQVDSLLYERTGISKKPEEVIQAQLHNLKTQDQMTSDLVFKDPYFINFVGLENHHSESVLEDFILNNITDFLQELGSDFCFVTRQKRMSTGKKDRYLDLLFFNRRLSRLIAIDLKIGDFDPAYKGQMEWYLNWLDKNERLPHENKPLGIILCAGKDEEDIEYLEMDVAGIHVASYITSFDQKNILEDRLKQAIHVARENYTKKILSIKE